MVYLSLQRYFQKYSIDISPEISKIRHGILLGLLQALGDVALGIVAFAGVPPFVHAGTHEVPLSQRGDLFSVELRPETGNQ